jgi:putative endonuclease
MSTKETGKKGEDAAAAYLKSLGCGILTRNYYIRGGEVDIIFTEGDVTVFCEVKARNQQKFGSPAEAVDARKRRRICKAALDYVSKNKGIDEKYRFDIIEFYNGRINHIKNAFEFIEP